MSNEVAVASQFSLVPTNLEQAMKLAELIANSDLAPKDYKAKPGNVLIAVQMGQEVGLSPMSAIQSIAVINGKPSLYGDVGKAILLRHGLVIEEDDVEVIKKTRMGRCRITRAGHPPCERTFSEASAVTAGLWKKAGPWTNYPERQMAWRAFWFAARDIASDLLKGLCGAEEVIDYEPKDITPMGAPTIAVLPPYADDDFTKNFPAWEGLIIRGQKTADEIIATVSSKAVLSDEQKKKINDVKKADAPVVTFAVVEERLQKAETEELLDLAADFIKAVADEKQRDELTAIYKTLKAKFAEK